MTGMVGLLKKIVRLLGAKKIDVLFIGLAARQPDQPLSEGEEKGAAVGEKVDWIKFLFYNKQYSWSSSTA